VSCGDAAASCQQEDKEMPNSVPHEYGRQDVIDLAQWLIAENVHSVHRQQMELAAKLQEAQDRNKDLVTANNELQERVSSLTEAYATLIGDGVSLAAVKEHLSTRLPNSDPTWCAQAAAVICRST
jgi:predicted transcriptional regulator